MTQHIIYNIFKSQNFCLVLFKKSFPFLCRDFLFVRYDCVFLEFLAQVKVRPLSLPASRQASAERSSLDWPPVSCLAGAHLLLVHMLVRV